MRSPTVTEPRSRGIAWAGAANLVGGVVGSVIGLVLAALVGRSLGTEGAGTYFLVVAVFMIVSSLAELGADTGLVRFVSAARATGRLADVPHLVRIAIGPVLLAGVLVVVLTAGIVDDRPFLGLPSAFIVLASALAVMSSMFAVMLSASRGLGDVLTYPLLQNIGLPLMRLVGVAVTILVGGGVVAVAIAWMAPVVVVLALATLVVVRLMTRRSGTRVPRRVRPPERRRLSREFWSFSATRGFAAAVEILLEWSDVLLVGALASAEAAGIYAVVTRCARASEVVQSAARIAIGPEISAALARGAVQEAGQIYGLVSAAMIWLSWPFFLLLAIFGDAVLGIFGDGFVAGAKPLAVLSLAMGLATAAGTVQTILLMGGRSTWQLADKSAALVLNLILNLALIPLWGITGAAISWAVTLVVDTVVVVYQVQRLMGIRPSSGARHAIVAAALSLAVVGASGLAVRAVFGSSLPVLAGTVLVVGVVYLAMSWRLRDRLGLMELMAHRA